MDLNRDRYSNLKMFWILNIITVMALVAAQAAAAPDTLPTAPLQSRKMQPGSKADRQPQSSIITISARLLSCTWPEPGSADTSGKSDFSVLQVECVYSDTAAAPHTKTIPTTLAVSGMPFEHCALGEPLQLLFLIKTQEAQPSLPGAIWEVVSSTPLLGDRQSVAQLTGHAGIKEQCFVDITRQMCVAL